MAVSCAWCTQTINTGDRYWQCKACGEMLCSERCARLHTDHVHRYHGPLEVDHQKKNDGGCFVTTAICMFEGRTDDCKELRLLRQFRDGFLMSTPEGRSMVESYYAIAPQLVQSIDGRADRHEVYRTLRDRFLNEIVEHVNAGANDAAIMRYRQMLSWLENITQ